MEKGNKITHVDYPGYTFTVKQKTKLGLLIKNNATGNNLFIYNSLIPSKLKYL